MIGNQEAQAAVRAAVEEAPLLPLRKRIAELEAENRRLRMEHEIFREMLRGIMDVFDFHMRIPRKLRAVVMKAEHDLAAFDRSKTEETEP